MATPMRNAAEAPFSRNTPKGRFWIGKPFPGRLADSTQLSNDGSCVSFSCDMYLKFLLGSAVVKAGFKGSRPGRERSGFGQHGAACLFQRLRYNVQVADMIG